ncbi:MAG: hypothetical protein PHX28_03350 [Candidatus Omnitrophica bacterium]|nr:hypothetical protein [Candidatus Omnitrophota bacterium]
MFNFKLQIEYEGTAYHGWQVQNGVKGNAGYLPEKTIQCVLEGVLEQVLREDIRLIVAGRRMPGCTLFHRLPILKVRPAWE